MTQEQRFIYFFDCGDDLLRIGSADPIESRIRQHERCGWKLLALMPGTQDFEDRIHRHFQAMGLLQGRDKSTYFGEEPWAYLAWLVEHGYATEKLEDAVHLCRATWEAIDPARTGDPHKDGDSSQTTLFPLNKKERVKHAHSVAYHASESDEWYTPPEIIEAARRVLGSIDLDPASCPAANRYIKARHYWSQAQSGLDPDHSWAGNVWLNPPYLGKVEQFMLRLIHELQMGRVRAALLLLNANSMSSRWFGPVYKHASALLVTTGRLRFLAGSDGQAFSSPATGSVISYFGRSQDDFVREFEPFGEVLIPRRRLLDAGEALLPMSLTP